MSSYPRPHADFLSFLRDNDLREAYEKEVRRIRSNIRREFAKKKADCIAREKQGIEIDAEHRRVLNACIYPFVQGQIPGYYFVRAAPLSELVPRVKNLDFLIICASPQAGEIKVAIAGEAKGNIDGYERIVLETKNRISVFKDRWDYVRETYLSGIDMQNEFVLGVLAIDSNETSKSIIHKGGEIIVWAVDIASDPALSHHRPELERENRSIRESMFHKNPRLSQVLNKFPTNQSFCTFYEQSHTVAKLRILTIVDKGKLEATFSQDDVKALVKEELDYVSDDEVIARETSTIVETAIRIGFVRHDNGRYRIKSRSKNAESRAREIEQLWIQSRLDEMLQREIDKEIANIQPKYEREQYGRPTLEEF